MSKVDSDYRIHRYLTDDRHTVSRPHELVIMWAPNGDYYIGSTPEGQGMIWQGVRICTSGGAASKNPELLKSVVGIFQALGGWSKGEPADKPDPESTAQQHLYDVTRLFHIDRQHNQFFERCEHEFCTKTREILDIRGHGHRFDKAWKDAVQQTQEFFAEKNP